MKNIFKSIRKRQLTDREQKFVASAIKGASDGYFAVDVVRSPGSVRSKPSKNDMFYPAWKEYKKLRDGKQH